MLLVGWDGNQPTQTCWIKKKRDQERRVIEVWGRKANDGNSNSKKDSVSSVQTWKFWCSGKDFTIITRIEKQYGWDCCCQLVMSAPFSCFCLKYEICLTKTTGKNALYLKGRWKNVFVICIKSSWEKGEQTEWCNERDAYFEG